MKKIRFNILFRSIQGAIGKKYVVKHYGKKIVITKYPCMEYIIPSQEQRRCRNLFAEAVAWAKMIIADPVRKAAWQKEIRRTNGVYNEAIKYYMINEKKKNLPAIRQIVKNVIKAATTEQTLKAHSKQEHGILRQIIPVIPVASNIMTCQSLNNLAVKINSG